MTREAGFYWIKVFRDGDWNAAEWLPENRYWRDEPPGIWLQIGDEQPLAERHVDVVGERITPPTS